MNVKFSRPYGSTLIVLVVLVILAILAVNATIRSNGIIIQAQETMVKTEVAKIKTKIQIELKSLIEGNKLEEETIKNILIKYGEVKYDRDAVAIGVITSKGNEILLKDIWGEIRSNQLLDNGVEIEPGTIVKTPGEWSTETRCDTSTNSQIVKETQVSSIYAVAIGDGISVPVPYGFYYVGGTLETGVVISDNEVDQNRYVGQSDVPSGLEIDENGSPIYTIQGNQFVWIPCTGEEYHKTAFGTRFQNSNWNTTEGGAELTQIQKYGGFYVGRFEAGLATDIPEFTTTQKHTASNQVYNIEGTPQLKPGKVAWNFVDWNHSKGNCENMYNTNYVNSGLITGTQWDVMVNKINTSDPTKSFISSNWGNYYNQQLTYTGRSAKVTNTNGSWYQEKLGGYVKNEIKVATSSNTPCYVLSTGASEQAKAYNLYDVAGNLWEWTQEVSTYQTSNQYRILRGGRM